MERTVTMELFRQILSLVLAGILAYLIGSINFAIIISKLFAKKDIRNYGSGNAGMTNVLRTFGKLP
ncbi:MAG: glycerol-3-phosphate acyltransferase, partial [Oscillospiraceae bacterium]